MSEESVPSVLPRVRSLLTDGIVIAVATAFAYLATFLYEVGYCSSFHIPYALISPNTSTLLVAAAAIGWIFLTSANLLGFTTPLFRRAKKGDTGWAILGYLAVAAILWIKIYEPTLKQTGWAILAVLAIFIGVPLVLIITRALILFLWRTVRRPKKPATEVSTQTSEAKQEYFFSADEFLENWLPQKVSRWILFIAGTLLFSFVVGDGNARTQKRFLITKGSPELVVLRIYGDVMIAATFDRTTKETLNGITVFSISEKKQLDFTNEKIGPLKAKEQ
jgi:hypothetical protein